jgi:putative exosortase-associated protein (TIGR04073 family)
LALLCLCLLVPATVSAKDSSARKLGRGFANVTLGVAAIPGEIMETTREKGPALGATWGFTKGVGMMVATELVGVWEVLTCPFEFPPGFKPILTPEYPWQYFTGSSRPMDNVAETRPSRRTVR